MEKHKNLVLREALQRGKYKVTPSRIRIFEELKKVKKPISVDEIYKKVSTILDRVTVYRTLEVFGKAGLISVFVFENQHRYELVNMHSHYLVCNGCRKVERIAVCTLDNIEHISLKASKHFSSLQHHTLQLKGLCKKCH